MWWWVERSFICCLFICFWNTVMCLSISKIRRKNFPVAWKVFFTITFERLREEWAWVWKSHDEERLETRQSKVHQRRCQMTGDETQFSSLCSSVIISISAPWHRDIAAPGLARLWVSPALATSGDIKQKVNTIGEKYFINTPTEKTSSHLSHHKIFIWYLSWIYFQTRGLRAMFVL